MANLRMTNGECFDAGLLRNKKPSNVGRAFKSLGKWAKCICEFELRIH